MSDGLLLRVAEVLELVGGPSSWYLVSIDGRWRGGCMMDVVKMSQVAFSSLLEVRAQLVFGVARCLA